MLHFGTNHYGKVDQVPGLFHVKTKFFHVHFIPLIPLGSYLLFDSNPENAEGIPIGWSWKSVLFAWLRATLLLTGAFLSLIALTGLVLLLEEPEHWQVVSVLCVVSLALFVLLYFSFSWTRARPLRALCLARLAEIEPEELAEYFVHHTSLAELEEQRGQLAEEV
ncbi:MAG: hypothetical protein AB7K24_11880 [Gemmataceae bacterium]